MTTVREALEAYERKSKSRAMKLRIQYSREHYFDEILHRRLGGLRRDVMKAWLLSLAKRGLKGSSVLSQFSILSAAVSKAMPGAKKPWSTWRPSELGFTKAPQTDRVSIRDGKELVLLLLAAERLDLRHKEMGKLSYAMEAIAVGALLGLNQAELAGMAWDDLLDDPVDTDWGALGVVRCATPGWSRRRGAVRPSVTRTTSIPIPHGLTKLLVGLSVELQARHAYYAEGPVFPDLVHLGARFRSEPRVLRVATLRELVRDARLPRPEKWNTRSLTDCTKILEVQAKTWGLTMKDLSERILEEYLRSPRPARPVPREVPPDCEKTNGARPLDLAPLRDPQPEDRTTLRPDQNGE